MARALSFNDAKRLYPNRYTIEHVPDWSFRSCNGKHYAPQYRSDREWYDNTVFPGEEGHDGFGKHCLSTRSTWPLGLWLDRPYRGADSYRAPDDADLPLDIREALVISRAQDDCPQL